MSTNDDVTYRGSITLPSGLNCPVHLQISFCDRALCKILRGSLKIVSILRKSNLPSAVHPSPHLSWKSRPHS